MYLNDITDNGSSESLLLGKWEQYRAFIKFCFTFGRFFGGFILNWSKFGKVAC